MACSDIGGVGIGIGIGIGMGADPIMGMAYRTLRPVRPYGTVPNYT